MFIHGRLRANRTADVLFHELVQGAGVSPFLFVTDDREVFLGTVAVKARSPSRPPRQEEPSVVGALGRYLESIEIFRDPLPGVVPVVNHRYSRLFSERSGPAQGTRL